MQSSLIRFAPRSARRSLAWLTLCAIAAPSSPAFAQSPARGALTALFGSSTADEDRASAADDSPDSDATEEPAPSPTASVNFSALGTPWARAPFAFVLPSAQRALALIPSKLPLQAATPATPAAQSAAATAATPAPASTSATSSADEGSGLRTAGYVAGGVGLVGLALFAIAGMGAKSAYDKLDSDCGGTPCTDEAHRSDIEGGRMLQTAANIGLATGLTGLGVGATLLVLGNGSPAEKRMPSASVSTNGGMITYGGHF